MFESKRPMFESKQPMFHRPLFGPKAADVGLKRPMSPKCQSGRCINFDQICLITHNKGSKAADVNFLSNMTYYSSKGSKAADVKYLSSMTYYS